MAESGQQGGKCKVTQHSRTDTALLPPATSAHSTAGPCWGLQLHRHTQLKIKRGEGKKKKSSSSPSCDNDDYFSHAPKYTKQHINSRAVTTHRAQAVARGERGAPASLLYLWHSTRCSFGFQTFCFHRCQDGSSDVWGAP